MLMGFKIFHLRSTLNQAVTRGFYCLDISCTIIHVYHSIYFLVDCWQWYSNVISVGVIYHASLIGFDSNMTINGLNCDECLCKMFTSSIFSLNCFTTMMVLFVKCFLMEFILVQNHSQMKINLNSTFYFRLSNQSVITSTQMMTSTHVTTSKGTSVSESVVSARNASRESCSIHSI